METCSQNHDEIVHSSDTSCPLCKERDDHDDTIIMKNERIVELSLIVDEIRKDYPEYLV